MTTGFIRRYWGKSNGDGWHPLAYHLLDVAAVTHELMRAVPSVAARIDEAAPGLSRLVPLLCAVHDIGKLSLPFQMLVPGLAARLTGEPVRYGGASFRHSDLGFILWSESDRLRQQLCEAAFEDEDVWRALLRPAFGHHGVPPSETVPPALTLDDVLSERQAGDLAELVDQLIGLLGPERPPAAPSLAVAERVSWYLAGLFVLADWIGSNRRWFRYQEPERTLEAYWRETALPAARDAIAAAGVVEPRAVPFAGFEALTGRSAPTPLQSLCETLEIGPGPQLFVIEDRTGSGKTEAAMLLAWRLIAGGHAGGLYYGLPTQATANPMFGRLDGLASRLFDSSTPPSLCLAHGRAELHGAWREAVIAAGQPEEARTAGEGDTPASPSANAWLADNRKKALLADVGVGTLDQALLGILPVRHQSLRLFGLAGSVLIADEVHAYDAYTLRLLEALLEMHAALGGSAILLTATLAAGQRRALLNAFRRGRGVRPTAPEADPAGDVPPYPLVTHWDGTRPEARSHVPAEAAGPARRLRCRRLPDAAAAVATVLDLACRGQCVCWVRNSVPDARDAAKWLLEAGLPEDRLLLFHASFTGEDRGRIENEVLARFGWPTSAPRHGMVLVATQVVEQSLDIDFDAMVTDLAPIDLIIQRFGRQHRHAVHGPRGEPVLYLVGPPPVDDPAPDWFEKALPRAAKVYPDHARLWLTQRLLTGPDVPADGCDLVRDVRRLIEAVYGPESEAAVPAGLREKELDAAGRRLGDREIARLSAIQLGPGYCLDGAWTDDRVARTRLGDRRVELALAVWEEGGLRPWAGRGGPLPVEPDDRRRLWLGSAVPAASWQVDANDVLGPREPAMASARADLYRFMGWREDWGQLVCVVAPLGDGTWEGAARAGDRQVAVRYHPRRGLTVTPAE